MTKSTLFLHGSSTQNKRTAGDTKWAPGKGLESASPSEWLPLTSPLLLGCMGAAGWLMWVLGHKTVRPWGSGWELTFDAF